MEAALDHKNSDSSRRNGEPQSLSEKLVRAERDLTDVIEALALLGIKRCLQCRHFFPSSDPGALFGTGNLVCYGCVPEWWPAYSGKIDVREREKIETKLSSWLRKYHGAQIVKEERGKTPETNPLEFKIVVHCSECDGSGKLLEGERCRFCNGFGTVWIIAPIK
jgi:hypothetical protein